MASFTVTDSYVALRKEEAPYNSCQEPVVVTRSPLIRKVVGAGLVALLIIAGVSIAIYFGVFHKNADYGQHGITTIKTVKKVKECKFSDAPYIVRASLHINMCVCVIASVQPRHLNSLLERFGEKQKELICCEQL